MSDEYQECMVGGHNPPCRRINGKWVAGIDPAITRGDVTAMVVVCEDCGAVLDENFRCMCGVGRLQYNSPVERLNE
jgi:hypothetical protein